MQDMTGIKERRERVKGKVKRIQNLKLHKTIPICRQCDS